MIGVFYIIEHNKDVIKSADWIIDSGPKQVTGEKDCKESYAGKFLKHYLS
jgi:excinuclease UvrABC ATPase subunit